MLRKNLLFALFLILILPLSIAYSDLAQVFNTDYPKTFEFLSKLPEGSVVLTWVDGGRALEEITKLKSVVKYPSQQLLDIGGFANRSYSGPFDDNEKLVDISKFFMDTDEKSALKIAHKYKAKHILVTDDMANKQNWMQHLAAKCDYVRNEESNKCEYYFFIKDTDKSNLEQAKKLSGELLAATGGYLYIPPKLKDAMLTKMLYKSESLEKLKLVYSDSSSKVFRVPADLTLIYVTSGFILAVVMLLAIAKRKRHK